MKVMNDLSKEHDKCLEEIEGIKNERKTLSQVKKKVDGRSRRKEERRNRLRSKS